MQHRKEAEQNRDSVFGEDEVSRRTGTVFLLSHVRCHDIEKSVNRIESVFEEILLNKSISCTFSESN